MNRQYQNCTEMQPAQAEDRFERRQHPRKFTHLTGVCLRLKGNQERIPIVVKDLSVAGVRIQFLQDIDLERDEVWIEFTLDDGFETLICLKGEVRWTLADSAGIKFTSPVCLINILTNYIYS